MSWDADTWRENSGHYCDQLIAIDTMEKSNGEYDDYGGRALFYESVDSEKPFPLDLMITDIDFSINEHTKVEPHIGNGFSFIAFGKNAMTCQVNGTLIDTGENFGKDTFMDIYRNYLRLEAVARRGVAPVLCFPNAAFYCAAMSVEITETAEADDVIYIALNLEILKAVFISEEENFMLDYIHGAELSEESVKETGAATDISLTSSSSSSSSSSAITMTGGSGVSVVEKD